jgi:hypothetical protein
MGRVILLLRSALAVGAGLLTLIVLVFGTIFLPLPHGIQPDGFPTTPSALSFLLLIEVVGGMAGAFVATYLAPSSPRVHGLIVGGLVLLLNALTVLEPTSAWPLVPAVLLIAFVPLQTWVGIVLATRIRSKSPALPQESLAPIPESERS